MPAPHIKSQHILKDGTSLGIRPLMLSDAQPLLSVLEAVIAEKTFLLLEPGELNMNLDEELRWIYRMQASEDQVYLVAQPHKETLPPLLGGVSLMRLENWRYAHLRRLGMFVHPDWRGKGVGKALLTEALQWARTRAGVEKIVLDVFTHNHAAIRLYQHLGFETEGRHPGQVKTLEGQYYDEISMGLWLSPPPVQPCEIPPSSPPGG